MSGPIELLQWARSFDAGDRPWLLLGKGPSFQRIGEVPLSEYRVCTLNHVVREVPTDMAHAIDLDVVIECAEAIERQARVLIMPWRPHVDHRPSRQTLAEIAVEVPVLRRLAAAGRLVWYNAATSKKPHGDSPVIDVRFFSAEAALNLLATIGARTVRSLGVDGGISYSSAFTDLDDKTRLANGHSSFDKQFAGIARTILRTGIDYAPWHLQSPIRVFVGADAAQIAGVKVLEYSIRKHASMSVDVQVIDDHDVPIPKDPVNRSRTGFSFSRFRIPELCGYQGRGIYVDADMQVFTDISQLWTCDFGDAHVLYTEQQKDGGRIPQFSVMLLDCGALNWDVRRIVAGLDAGSYDYGALMQQMCILPPERRQAKLPPEWNSLENYEAGRTKLIHYTDMPTQPWVSHRNANGHLWYSCCREALDAGFISRAFLDEEIERGHVSPELPGWLGLSDLSDVAARRAAWTPPYRRFTSMANVPQLGDGLDPAPRGSTVAMRGSLLFSAGMFGRVRRRLARLFPRGTGL
jgi:hypothetical protein